MFCPNDKAMLRPVGGIPTCPKCGYQKTGPAQAVVVKGNRVEDDKKSIMVDMTTEKKVDLLPTTNEYPCEKCGASLAYYYLRQTRSADEATTRFLECVKCGYKWRDYR